MKSTLDRDYQQFLELKGLAESQNEEDLRTIKTYEKSHSDLRRPENVADVSYQNKQLTKPSRDGSIQLLSNVIATFDSRFVNGIDFSISNFDTWTVSADPPTSLSLISTFTIPGGYNAVVKGYRYAMVPDVPIDKDNLILNISSSGTNVFSMKALKHGTVIPGFISCFFLAGAGTDITLNFSASSGIATTAAQALITPRKISVELIGNYLIDTGAPLEFEIANFEQQQRNIAQRILIR